MDSFSYTHIKSTKRAGLAYDDKYHCVVALRKQAPVTIHKSDISRPRPLIKLSVNHNADSMSNRKHTVPTSAPAPSQPRVLKKTQKETNCIPGKPAFVIEHQEKANPPCHMKRHTAQSPSTAERLPHPLPKHERHEQSRRVLVKKKPQPKPNKPRVVKKIEKCYSSNKPCQTTITGSLLGVITGVRKDTWADPDVTGEYISFLPSLKETKDRNEIFRRQGVVSGYPKRVIPPYKEGEFGPPRKKKNKWFAWPLGEDCL